MASAASAQIRPLPLIHAAAADAEQTTLIVQGKNFAPDAAAYLGVVPLGGVTVNDAGTVLTATITGTAPGSYQLRIGNGRLPDAFLDVTLGAVGPRGPQGEQGLPGADHSVAITALTGELVELTRRVAALEALLVNFSKSGDDVTIKANAINLVAATKVSVDAAASVDVRAGVDAKLRGTTVDIAGEATTTIKGGLVKIN